MVNEHSVPSIADVGIFNIEYENAAKNNYSKSTKGIRGVT